MAENSSTSANKKKVVDATKENPTFVYDIGKDSEEQSFRYVDQDIPESEKTPQWYIDNIHYISTFYNVPMESVLAPGSGALQAPGSTGASGIYSNNLIQRDLPINRMLKNMSYYQGKQENTEYADWTTGNVAEQNYQAHWIKGQDIAELLNFMKGNMLERIVNLQITAKALSEHAVSEKQDYRTKLLMKYRFRDVFAELEQQGVQFNVGPKEGLESEEAIDDFMEKNYKQNGVDVAMAIAKDFWFKSFGLHKFLDSFLKCLITGTAQMHHYVQNGKLFMQPIPSWQMIYDTRHDDDYNRDAQFIGIVETMTPTEVFSRFPQLTKAQREEIKLMARTKDLGVRYNVGFTNFLWWNYNIKREECVVSVVTSYWIGRHDMGLKKTKDKFEVDRMSVVGKGEKGDYVVDDIYKGTLIGNRFLLEYGLDDNIVEDPMDKSKPLFPIVRYLPNMVGGEPRAMVSRFTDMQDEIDALKFMVRQAVGRWMGKCFIVRGDVGNNTQLQEIYKDFKSMGLTVLPPSGEDGADKGLGQMVDFSLDPNIMRIEEIVKMNRDLLKEYASVSNVSLGMQTSYMGMGERNSAIGQSTYGLASLYNGFMDFIQMNLQYAANVEKTLLTMDGNDTEASFVVGDKGVLFLKIMKEMKFEDFLIIIKLNDSMDEAARKEMQQVALGWAQNNVLDPDAWIKVRQAETFSEATKVLEYAMKKKRKEQAEQQQAQQEHDQQMQAQQGQALQQAEMLRQAGQDSRAHINADAKKEVAVINKVPEPGANL